MPESILECDVAAPVARITLNRPDQLNALSYTLVDSLRETLRRVGADEAVELVVLAGAGRAFCAGYDMSEEVAGRKKTSELLFTGEATDAAEAERIGLVSRVVPAAANSPEQREFADIAARDGLKAALAWRDERYGRIGA